MEKFFLVKTIEECRGLEFPVLVTISNEGNIALDLSEASIIDAWTRVTTSLFIIHMEYKYGPLNDGLKDALENQVALIAEEQEIITYNTLKKLFFIMHKPECFVIIFLGGFWLIVSSVEAIFVYAGTSIIK